MSEEKTYEPEMELSYQEKQELAGLAAHPGFRVFQKLGKWTVDQFVLAWINAETSEEVLTAHKAAKFSAQFYSMLIKRISQEVSDHVTTIKENGKPVDSAEALDLGEFTLNEEESFNYE